MYNDTMMWGEVVRGVNYALSASDVKSFYSLQSLSSVDISGSFQEFRTIWVHDIKPVFNTLNANLLNPVTTAFFLRRHTLGERGNSFF